MQHKDISPLPLDDMVHAPTIDFGKAPLGGGVVFDVSIAVAHAQTFIVRIFFYVSANI
jgi:hypothetical protein